MRIISFKRNIKSVSTKRTPICSARSWLGKTPPRCYGAGAAGGGPEEKRLKNEAILRYQHICVVDVIIWRSKTYIYTQAADDILVCQNSSICLDLSLASASFLLRNTTRVAVDMRPWTLSQPHNPSSGYILFISYF